MGKRFVGVVSVEDDGTVRVQVTEEVSEGLCLTEGRIPLAAVEQTIKAAPA